MRSLKFVIFGFLVVLIFATGALAQEVPANTDVRDDHPKDPADTLVLANISSTAPGGPWSSPSTWAGGVVPGAGDNVTIVVGSTVVIDTAAAAGNLTINGGGITPGILTFDPGTARSLTVAGNLTLQDPLTLLTTPSTGTVTNHTVTVGGNLTNNGNLDLSTNNNQAGADLVFTNASSSTFGGNGAVNDVRTITVNKGTTSASTLTLSILAFTVQGSGTDTAASGYLTLTNGTFKISGTFAGNHRTLKTANYTIPATASLWLDNANYTVAAQNGDAAVSGLLRISAGTYNVGTAADHSLMINPSAQVVVEGGNMNVAGSFKTDFPGLTYTQSGGTVTLCIAGNVEPCFGLIGGTGTGGDLVIQTPRPVPDENFTDYWGNLTGGAGITTVHFGNALTPGTAFFTAKGGLPNVVIDTTSGPHTLKLVGNSSSDVGDINIGSGGTLDIGDNSSFRMIGNTFVNNGTLKVKDTSSISLYCGDGTYSGTGSFSGPVNSIFIQCNSLTFDPAAGGIRARNISLDVTHLINSGKLTLGNNDNLPSSLILGTTASLDSSPTFDLGTGGMKLTYWHTSSRTMGPEIPPSRTLNELFCDECTGPITLTGGDLTIQGPLKIGNAVIDTGSNRIVHFGGTATRGTGYIRGTLDHKFTSNGSYNYFVGDNHFAPVFIQPTALPTNPTFVSVKPVDAALPGIPAGTSASFSWTIEQSAPLTGTLRLTYGDEDINGNESSYKLWRNTQPLPLLYSASQTATSQNWTSITGLTSFNGTWGVGASIPTISISGGVFASNGSGIRNAIVMLSGGSLAAPRIVQTGPFGTYIFSGVDPGGEYTVTGSAKRNRFSTSERIISSWSSVANVDFVANPPESKIGTPGANKDR